MTTAVATWSIEWKGSRWSEADLTGQHLAVLAILSGSDSYDDLVVADLSPALGHQRLMNMIAAFAVVDAGTDDPGVIATVIAEIAATPAEEILGALRFD